MTTPATTFRGGRLPAEPARPHLKAGRLLHPELPPPPAAADWLSQVPAAAWGVVKGAKIEGGHCVTIGAYDADGLTVVTWGQTQRMTWRFFRKYFQEAWIVLGPDDIDPKSGKDRDGLDLAALEADFRALTGQGLAV